MRIQGGSPSNLAGIGFMVFGTFCFVLNDSLMKLAMGELPPFQVLAFRGMFGTVFLVPMLAWTGQLRHLASSLNRYVIGRGLLEVGAIVCFAVSLANAPIADITAIFQTTPLLIILGMAIVHREPVDGFRLSLVAAGFAGALMVAQPGGPETSPFAMLAFFTAFFAAARDLVGRHIPGETPVLVSTMVTVLLVLIASVLIGLSFEDWSLPAGGHIVSLSAAGLLMAFGHVFTFLAYRRAEAQAVAPFYYAFMLWALILGYLMFSEVPNTLAHAGMALIFASGIAIVWRERRAVAEPLA